MPAPPPAGPRGNTDYLLEILLTLPKLEMTAGLCNPKNMKAEARASWEAGCQHLGEARRAFALAYNELDGGLEITQLDEAEGD